MNSKWSLEYEYLRKAILEEKKSYEEIGREYGCSGSNIKKVAKKIGIDLPKKRKVNPNETFNRKERYCLNCGEQIFSPKFCGKKCECEYKHRKNYEKFLNNPEKYERANYTPSVFKKDFLEEQNNKCAICGIEPEWNGNKLVFILDHIDGHASHNYRKNLRLICPNCDSQLDTYKSKNKNGERSYYRYHRSALDNNTEV